MKILDFFSLKLFSMRKEGIKVEERFEGARRVTRGSLPLCLCLIINGALCPLLYVTSSHMRTITFVNCDI